MSNLKVIFSNSPWLFLLLIPAFVIGMFPYLRMERKHRRTRNRIISLVLHLTIMVFSITALTGIAFAFDSPVEGNEMIIVVDVSYSNHSKLEEKELYIKGLLDSNESSFKVGIIVFATEPTYLAELSFDTNAVYDLFIDYTNSIKDKIENPALYDEEQSMDKDTNIFKALLLARDCFTNPKAGKIVLLSDGLETQGNAAVAAATIASNGIIIDTIFFNNDYGNESQIVSIRTPDRKIFLNEETEISINVQSTVECMVSVTLFDNGEPQDESDLFELKKGYNTIPIMHTFKEFGSHQLYAIINAESDTISQNNSFYTYIAISKVDKVLILQNGSDGSGFIDDILNTHDFFKDIISARVDPIQNAPKTLKDLAEFDQVILMNTANSDMPEGFVEILDQYVKLGGGLLTVGGDRLKGGGSTDSEPHIYNIDEMFDMDGNPTLFQKMLPVDCDGYTPPISVMVALDSSKSMGENGENLDLAKNAVVNIIKNKYLSPVRDRFGIVTFNSTASTMLPLTRVGDLNYSNIANEFKNITAIGGTNWHDAIAVSLQAFSYNDNTRKHIILITDGQPDPSLTAVAEQVKKQLLRCAKSKVTFSIVAIGQGTLTRDAETTKGWFNSYWHTEYGEEGNGLFEPASDITALKPALEKLFSTEGILGSNRGRFIPKIGNYSSITKDIKEEDLPALYGFYGVKAKSDKSVITPLIGEFTPIYAQWDYGEGKVGSLMVDLNKGNDGFSTEFMASEVGKQILLNIINSLFPLNSLEIPDVLAKVSRKNSTLTVSIENTNLDPGDRFSITVESITYGKTVINPEPQIVDQSNGRPTAEFTLFDIGIYRITILKQTSGGTVLSKPLEIFESFSYYDEFDCFPLKSGESLLFQIGNTLLFPNFEYEDGELTNKSDYTKSYDGIPKTYPNSFNPRTILIISIVCLFLLDIAVRKFKFKWPWEIARDKRTKRGLGGNAN